MDASKKRDNPNPRDSAGILSIMFHWWLLPLFRAGYSKVLTPDDLYDPVKGDRSKLLGDRLEMNWIKELKKAEGSERAPSLLRALAKTFWPDYSYLAFITVTTSSLTVIESLLLGQLLHSLKAPENLQLAMYYAIGLVSCLTMDTLMRTRYDVSAWQTGLRLRAACCSLIYKKSLRLSCGALGETAIGQVVNLLANDVNRFDFASIFLNYMWTAPLQTGVIMYILWRNGGVASLVGIVVFFIVVPLQSYIGKLSSVFRRLIAYRSDERIRLVGEIISGAQVIKMYAWEKPFLAIVEIARRHELAVLKKLCYVRGLYMTFHLCITRLGLFTSLVTMALLDIPITAEKVFMFVSLFNIVSFSFSGIFVRGVAEISECYVSIKRLQKYLLYEECQGRALVGDVHVNGKNSTANGTAPVIKAGLDSKDAIGEDDQQVAVELENVTAKWTEKLTDDTLRNVDIKINRGASFAIIGPVGAGKTSVLQTILGELQPSSGSVNVRGKISYACQDPWVFASTVRQNIIFGTPFERRRYDEVVRVCALRKDFEQFPHGDLTLVGERGASLSGGQKARINLARAVYRRADLYLLDDPLSAVDAHVGRHLFEECICGFLRHKTRILVTHQVHHLSGVDRIVLLKEGSVAIEGTYRDLANSGIDYANLLGRDEEVVGPGDEKGDKNPEASEIDQTTVLAERTVFKRQRSRASYTSSTQSINPSEHGEEADEPEPEHPLVDNIEATSKGQIRGPVYLHYWKHSQANILGFFIVPLFFLLAQITASGADYWLKYWTNLEEKRRTVLLLNSTFLNDSSSGFVFNETESVVREAFNATVKDSVPDSLLPKEICVYIYLAIVLSIFFTSGLRSYLFYRVILRISEFLHGSMLNSIIYTSMKFFDINPSGRVLNRFSKDMGSLDEILPKAILDASQMLLAMFGALTVSIVINPYMIFPIFGLGVLFVLIRQFYLKTSKNIKRLEGMVRSPVFSHLNVTLQGMSTIRAFGAQDIVKAEFDKHQDLHSSAWYLQICTGAAFGLSLDLISVILVITVASSVFMRQGVSVAEVGLAFTQALMLSGMMQWGARQSAEVANNMMAAERILEYCQLPPEKEPAAGESQRVPKDWPNFGELEFQHVYLRYSPDANPVLVDLNFRIEAGEKVGIVGRTGTGKSSLITAIFRLTQPEGVVLLDGVNTANIPLSTLRSSISIIPQDPVLFSGTMRYNLDPFDEYADSDLWSALEEVDLKELLSHQQGLQTRINERGSNFSVGQRQLVCLARAILRKNRLLMLDEATANVDPQTDALIQQTIREKFKSCTVLTVAHRLNTIMDSDRVLVMESGSIVEFDHPFTLLQNPEGRFSQMVQNTGSSSAEQLLHVAKTSYELRHEKA